MLLFRGINLLALLLCFVVVVFGAFVRLSNAGLGCPDWPGCYGHLTVTAAAQDSAATVAQAYPGRPVVEPPKAWKEMIHRYLVGSLSTLIVLLVVLAALDRGRRTPRGLVLFLPALVLVQIVFGALTVTMKLNPLVVTTHLLLGLSTLALIWLIWLRGVARLSPAAMQPASGAPAEQRYSWFFKQQDRALPPLPCLPLGLRLGTGAALLAVALQIFLGGWTSSNYAATACPDFPTCLGSFAPQTAVAKAFRVWQGSDANYEFGRLDGATRATIHLLHRYGAAVVTLVVGGLALFLLRTAQTPLWRRLGWALLGALLLQLAIGVSLVELRFPLLLADAHNAGAALLLLTVVAVNYFAWRRQYPTG